MSNWQTRLTVGEGSKALRVGPSRSALPCRRALRARTTEMMSSRGFKTSTQYLQTSRIAESLTIGVAVLLLTSPVGIGVRSLQPRARPTPLDSDLQQHNNNQKDPPLPGRNWIASASASTGHLSAQIRGRARPSRSPMPEVLEAPPTWCRHSHLPEGEEQLHRGRPVRRETRCEGASRSDRQEMITDLNIINMPCRQPLPARWYSAPGTLRRCRSSTRRADTTSLSATFAPWEWRMLT